MAPPPEYTSNAGKAIHDEARWSNDQRSLTLGDSTTILLNWIQNDSSGGGLDGEEKNQEEEKEEIRSL